MHYTFWVQCSLGNCAVTFLGFLDSYSVEKFHFSVQFLSDTICHLNPSTITQCFFSALLDRNRACGIKIHVYMVIISQQTDVIMSHHYTDLIVLFLASFIAKKNSSKKMYKDNMSRRLIFRLTPTFCL